MKPSARATSSGFPYTRSCASCSKAPSRLSALPAPVSASAAARTPTSPYERPLATRPKRASPSTHELSAASRDACFAPCSDSSMLMQVKYPGSARTQPGRAGEARRQALRQRPNTRPPTVKPSPNVPSENAPTANRLAPQRQAPPAADRLLVLVREGLATPLLPGRSTGPKPEIDVVEQLRRLFGHGSSV